MPIATGDGLVADDRVTLRRKRRGWREITKGAARCGSPNLRNMHKGDSMSELDVVLGMLKQSVVSIKGANGADTEALLAKSFDQFAEATREIVGAAEANAFEQGRYADLLKHDGVGDALAKGMDHVAGFALVMKQLEFFLESWADEVEEEGAEGQGGEPPVGLQAAAQFYQIGQQVLKILVGHATGDEEGVGEQQPPAEGAAQPASGAPEPPPAEPSVGEKPPAEPKPPAAEEGNQSDDKPPPAAEEDDEEKKKALGKADGGDMLAKFDALERRMTKIATDGAEALAKAEADKAVLRAEIEALRKSTPAPARGAVMAVGKEADNALAKGDGPDLQAEAERLNQLQKSDPAAYALALMKAAQRNPLPFDPRRQ